MSSNRPPISNELRPYVDRVDGEGIDRTAERLWESRPAPTAEFRADLGARLRERGMSGNPWTGRRLRVAVAAYGVAGIGLLGLAAIGVSGVGPLGF